MTITKEQAAQWHITANEVAGGESDYLQSFAQLAYTAGAEAKLAELLEGVEMPTTSLMTATYSSVGRMESFWDEKKMREYAAAAVAKKDAEIVTAKYNEDTWYGRFMEAAQKVHDLQREVAALTAERDATLAKVEMLKIRLNSVYGTFKNP